MLVSGAGVFAGEIGFDEDYALAADRSAALKQLIPGTKEYYYYHCLYYQQTGESKKLEEMMNLWQKRYGDSDQLWEIRNRSALLGYAKDPEKSIKYIRDRLNLHFDHQKQDLDRKTNYPTTLDQKLVSRERLQKEAFNISGNTLSQFEDSALEFLVTQNLDGDRRRDLLRRITRPDYPGFAELIIADLKHENSGGFGSHPVHGQMLLSQLDKCLMLMPELINNTNFIRIYMSKLRPGEDIDWNHDAAAKAEYFERLWAFARQLPSNQNSLKVHVLFHKLSLGRTAGVYDKKIFAEYIRLPRNVFYINRVYMERDENRNVRADINADFKTFTMLVQVQNDEPIVRDYLQHLLRDAPDFREYEPFFEQNYLKEVFAETKILNGIGNMEQWYSLMTPDRYQQLKERVDLDFLPANREVIGVDDKVVLAVAVKNVPALIIKTYKINTRNYYRDGNDEITTAVDLDGLVANDEKVIKYDHIELRRHIEKLELHDIKGPGVYVVELIGSGKSSRAVIRKGKLRFTERTGSAGHIFTVYDDNNKRLKTASIWMSGQEYQPDKDGTIAIPFSNEPGTQRIIISNGDFSELYKINHRAEEYSLQAGFFVDRESLLAGSTCELLVRPQLRLSGEPVDISLLENVKLTMISMDRDSIETTKDVEGFKLFNDREYVYRFRVPEDTLSLNFTLSGKVENLSRGRKDDLAESKLYFINGMDMGPGIEGLHFRHINGNYCIDVLGKSGEQRPDKPVYLNLKHRDFKREVHVLMQSDENGRVNLGELKDIVYVKARSAEEQTYTWGTIHDRHSFSGSLNGAPGMPLYVPVMDLAADKKEDIVSLMEVRDGTFVNDCRENVKVTDGFLVIEGLKAGDYNLKIKGTGAVIGIRITDGPADNGYFLSRDRQIQFRNLLPLQITGIGHDEKNIKIQLANSTASTRVHVVATRFVPEFSVFDNMDLSSRRSLLSVYNGLPLSIYLSGRKIGDEYRYILERKYTKKYPGNLLKRPGLLLNPWSLQKTDTGTETLEEGEAWNEMQKQAEMKSYGGKARSVSAKGDVDGPMSGPSLDFLPSVSLVLDNLVPDEKGVVTIDRAKLGPRQELHVCAVDELNTVYRELALPETAEKYRDLRLVKPLDKEKHFTERKNISIVGKGQDFAIEDTRTAKVEVYDSLAKVFALYSTISGDANLAEFRFILDWPDLKEKERLELYSKYACHELNFFIYKKDPAYFKSVILPYVKNKKDKTFMDNWLTGADLSMYMKPWAYGRLNAVERILLGRHIDGEAPAMARHIKDLYDLVPPDIERFNYLFTTAIKGSAMETGGGMAACQPLAAADLEASDPFAVGGEKAPVVAATLGLLSRLRKSAPAPKEEAMADAVAMGVPVAQAAAVVMEKDKARRGSVRQLYRKLDKTEELVENNYYKLPIEDQVGNLVNVNGFWKDYAACKPGDKFLTVNIAEASDSFTEMMFALAVLDLPFKSPEHDIKNDEGRQVMRPGCDSVIYHREIKTAGTEKQARPFLVSQNFFALDDRYIHVDNEQFDKFVTDEFLARRVYGCQVVLTNPTSGRRKVDVLLQVPAGAVPVMNGFYTRSRHYQLEPYSTQTIEYYFYFPSASSYTQYPVHIAQDEQLQACTQPFVLNVVDKLSRLDKTSWQYVSQYGSDSDVLDYLKNNNIDRLNLELIAFRMRERKVFGEVLTLLAERHVYNDTLWSYGIYNNDVPSIREYLRGSGFAAQCGMYIASALLDLDPVERHGYQHREYWPFVNARVYQVGGKKKILNDQFFLQYSQFMAYLRYKPELDDADRLGVAYYMFLQDRVEEALGFFDRVNPAGIPSVMQYDLLKTYALFYRSMPEEALKIAKKYENYPVERWKNSFVEVIAQAAEIMEAADGKVVDKRDRDQRHAQLTENSANLEFAVENRKMKIHYQNTASCRINYYMMDIELLFSRNPFVQEVSGQFSVIHPNDSVEVKLPEKKNDIVLDLLDKYRDSNVMIEITVAGVTRTQAYYPHSLAVQVIENYGQLRIAHEKSGKAITGVYVKVYARMNGGEVRFYKDGYTDLRGRFDYTSLSTDELSQVEKFAILIMSPENGSVVREANPPKQ